MIHYPSHETGSDVFQHHNIVNFQLITQERYVRLTLNLPGPLVIAGNHETLNRAFSNLFDNAIKYNVDGGRVEIECVHSNDMVSITMTNTGPGVDPKHSGCLFEPFYRVEPSRSIRFGGVGLGLAIVKRTVDLHKGQISFKSSLHDFTLITITLPTQLS